MANSSRNDSRSRRRARVWVATRVLALPLLALPLLAHADADADAAVQNAQTLGLAESMLSYCAPHDPAAAARLREQIKALAAGVSETQLADVRSTDEYRKAYDSVTELVAKVDEHNTQKFCARILAHRR